MRVTTFHFSLTLFTVFADTLHAKENEISVKNRAELAAALGSARPGTVILVAPGIYEGGLRAAGVSGEKGKPVVVKAADVQKPPVITGGAAGIHLSGCSWVELDGLTFTGGRSNGVNVDDAGLREKPAQGIVLRNLIISQTGDGGERGNHDGIKLSGVNDLTVAGCKVSGWGRSGSGIDMVGCHGGTVEDCTFEHDPEKAMQANGVQTKGGSAGITIRRCRFIGAGGRGVNIGGSTGADFMRPANPGSEAKDITVEDCYFANIMAPVAFVGVDGAVVQHNTLHHPRKWVMRILQENRSKDFTPCRKGVFRNNLIVFRAADMREAVNTGGGTEPASFTFSGNAWFCEDNPGGSARIVRLPSPETEGLHGTDPQLADPAKGDYRRKPGTLKSQGVREEKP